VALAATAALIDIENRLLVAVSYTPAGQVVGGHLDLQAITGQDANMVLTHLATQVTEHLVSVVEFDSEMATLEGFNSLTLQEDGVVFLLRQTFVPLIDGTVDRAGAEALVLRPDARTSAVRPLTERQQYRLERPFAVSCQLVKQAMRSSSNSPKASSMSIPSAPKPIALTTKSLSMTSIKQSV